MPPPDKLEDPHDWLLHSSSPMTGWYILHEDGIDFSTLARSEQAPTGKRTDEAVCL